MAQHIQISQPEPNRPGRVVCACNSGLSRNNLVWSHLCGSNLQSQSRVNGAGCGRGARPIHRVDAIDGYADIEWDVSKQVSHSSKLFNLGFYNLREFCWGISQSYVVSTQASSSWYGFCLMSSELINPGWVWYEIKSFSLTLHSVHG